VEIGGDGADAEYEDEEVERVERPAQEAGDEGVALLLRERAEIVEEPNRDEELGRRKSSAGAGELDRSARFHWTWAACNI
jgi:hypothetical protein